MQKTLKANVQRRKRPLLVLAFLIIIAIYSFVTLKGEYLQMLEIGEQYIDVFNTNLKMKTITILINFSILFLIMYLTTRKIKKGLKSFFVEEKLEIPKLPNKSISLVFSTIVTLLLSNTIMQKGILAFKSAWFEISDPVFNMDIGFYMFQKPFIEFILFYIIIVLAFLILYIALYYIITFNVYFKDGINVETLKKSAAIKQITKIIILISIGIALITLIKTQDILFDKFLKIEENTKGLSLFGAGVTDVTIKLWGYRILALLIPISTIFAIKNLKRGNVKKCIITIAIIPVFLVMLFIVMLLFQIIYVRPNELDKQKTYINYNIDYTRNAYGINIEEKEIENTGIITEEDIANNEEILSNIAIVSEDITLKNLMQYQTNSGYYQFNSTQLQLCKINGVDRLVYVTPREVTNGNRTYNDKTYEYTHGFGTIVTSAVTTNENGSLNYIQKDILAQTEDIKIEQPRIYFGIETNDTIITNAKGKKEFDYQISGEKNNEFSYTGEAGIDLNFFDRLVLGISKGDFKLAFNTNYTEDSKILTNRNVLERAKKVMPYLLYDENPYLVLTNEGDLKWVLDAYTISNNYPYSQETTIHVNGMRKDINYIRNSVKVIIDAYDGTVQFYITDRTDPIVMAYRNIYKNLFMDLDAQIPTEIQEHIVYPQYLYEIQADILKNYHKVQTEVLYRNDDTWEIAKQSANKATVAGVEITPYYTLIKENEKNDIGLIIPYTLENKQNLVSYLVGTYDEDSKLKLVLYKFKDGSNVLGAMQLVQQLEEDKTISQELAKLEVPGTKVIKNLMIIPINNTLLYVEPIYQVAVNESQAPILKKVIVASGNKVSIGNNLKEALENLLSHYAVDIEIENTDNVEDLIQLIIKANNNLEESNKSNDWELIGKDMKKLQALIKKLEETVEPKKGTIIQEIANTLLPAEQQ